jgi:hypothetical protein
MCLKEKRNINNVPSSIKIPSPILLTIPNLVFKRPKSKGIPREKKKKENVSNVPKNKKNPLSLPFHLHFTPGIQKTKSPVKKLK